MVFFRLRGHTLITLASRVTYLVRKMLTFANLGYLVPPMNDNVSKKEDFFQKILLLLFTLKKIQYCKPSLDKLVIPFTTFLTNFLFFINFFIQTLLNLIKLLFKKQKKSNAPHEHSFFRVGGWLVYEILMLAFRVGTPNANYCKQGYLVGQK